MNDLSLAIDIGGTETGFGLFKPGFGLLKVDKIPTQPDDGCTALIRRVYVNSLELLKQSDIGYERIAGVGMLSPGPLNLSSGSIVHAPMLGWRDIPLVKTAENVFQRPATLQVDTSGAAIGEYMFGCGETKPKVLIYITVSTGIGCGILIGGRIYNGANDAAGELGHLKINDNGIVCECGGIGCLETMASGTGIANLAISQIGKTLLAKEVFALASDGDFECTQIIKQAGTVLGTGIATILQLFDPSIVILGGSVSQNFHQLEPFINDVLSYKVQNFSQRKVIIRKTELPNGHNTLLGAGVWFSDMENFMIF